MLFRSSALKHQGKPLYAYARSGEIIERQTREIIIHGIQIQSLLHNELQLNIHCGTGTYIRTLAEDIGKALGCGGAYLLSLRRTAIDRFQVTQAHTLSALEEMNATERDACLLPVDCLLHAYPAVTLNDQSALLLQQGRTIEYQPDNNAMPIGEVIRLYNRQHFMGLGEITAKQEIMAKRLLSNSYWSEIAV